MRLIYLALLVMMSSGCATDGMSLVDPELQPIYDDFLSLADKYNIGVDNSNIVIKLGTLGRTIAGPGYPAGAVVIGECSQVGPYSNILTITIDRDLYKRGSELMVRLDLFHELGHCLLKRPHSNGRSIMSPVLMSEMEYFAHKSAYEHELFFPGQYR